jgi:hypothetical protein
MFPPNRERLPQPPLSPDRSALAFLLGEWTGRGELEGIASQPVSYECQVRIEASTRPGEVLLHQQVRLLSLPEASAHPAFWTTCRIESIGGDRYRLGGHYGSKEYRVAGQIFLPASSVQFRRLTFQESSATQSDGWTTISFFEREGRLRYLFENYDARWHTSRFRLEARLAPVH